MKDITLKVIRALDMIAALGALFTICFAVVKRDIKWLNANLTLLLISGNLERIELQDKLRKATSESDKQ